jgi:hypothetical protein
MVVEFRVISLSIQPMADPLGLLSQEMQRPALLILYIPLVMKPIIFSEYQL